MDIFSKILVPYPSACAKALAEAQRERIFSSSVNQLKIRKGTELKITENPSALTLKGKDFFFISESA